VTIAALALYGVFGFVALVVRGSIAYIRIGRSPILVPPTPLAWAGQLALTFGLFAAPVGVAIGDEGSLGAVGLGLLTLGVLGTVVAQAQMGRSWRAGVDPNEKTVLITGGLFSLVRNPIYVSMIAAGAGMALVVFNALTAVSAVAILLGSEILVRGVEEPYLRSVHGEAFESYAARTPRFIGVRRARPRRRR
jgi:protein-S-isoprenylcysteine O-methyltransferase Ste14